MGKIVRRVLDGYVTLIEWSPSDPATVEAAEMIFRREVEGGYMAVVEDDGVHSGEPVRSLPVGAERRNIRDRQQQPLGVEAGRADFAAQERRFDPLEVLFVQHRGGNRLAVHPYPPSPPAHGNLLSGYVRL